MSNLFYRVKDLNSFAIPLVLSMLSGCLIGMVDQAFVGHISTPAYAGVGLISSWYYSLIGVLGALAILFNIQGAKVKDDEDKGAISRLFTAYMAFSFTIGAICAILLIIFRRWILLSLFSLDPLTYKEAEKYMLIITASIPVNMTIFILTNVMKIYRLTKYILFMSIAANLLNVGLDRILIFGWWIFPPMGVEGAAIGSMIALFFNAGFYFFLVRTKTQLKFVAIEVNRVFKDIFKRTLPFWGEEVFEDIIFVTGLNALVARMGVVPLAVYTFVVQINDVIQMPMFGYATAHTTLFNEARENAEVENRGYVTRTTIFVLTLWFIMLCILFFLNENRIVAFITDDHIFRAGIKEVAYIAVLSQYGNYIFTVLKSVLQSLGNAEWLLKRVFLTNSLILCSMWAICKNITSVFLIIGCSYVLNASLMYLHIQKLKRSKSSIL